MGTVAEATLTTEPDAVPSARHLVRSAVADHGAAIAADAELLVSELVTNAVLHGEPPVTVRVLVEDGRLRIEVEDAGRSAPILLQQNTETMTGRGLALVAAVASAWGVEAAAGGGKVVWAELDVGGEALASRSTPNMDVDELLAAWSDEESGGPVTYTVRLGAVATDLLLSAKAHIDNVVRELMLMREGEASSGVPLAPEMAALVETVTVDFADARSEIKRQATAAASRGDAITDLELHLPASAADAGERYLDALDQGDRYARSAHLLTLAPPPVHRIFRQWYVRELVDQLRSLAAGQVPPEPRPFLVVLTEEVTRLADEAAASSRLTLLQKVTSELADVTTVEAMARIVVDNSVHYLGVESARVRLLTPDRYLRTVADAGGIPGGSPYPDYSLDADLPGAEAARTGKPIFLRSLSDALRGEARLAGLYRPGLSAHVMPLVVGDQTLGILSLTFIAGELSDEAEFALVAALADALAQGLKRVELAEAEAQSKESLRFLAEATQMLVTAREPAEVMEGLVKLAVPRLGDWCTVYLADGPVLRRAAMAIAGHPELAESLKQKPVELDLDVPQTRAFHTGRPEWMNEGVGRLLESVYPEVDIAALGGDPDGVSGLAVPIERRHRRIGVIALTYMDGRRVTPAMVETMSELGARAALAFESAQRWSAQHQVVETLVEALLPGLPPSLAGVEFVARYLPASGEVAGDWWEAQEMPDGTVLIGVGDAAGHGLAAVSLMSELRQGARALAGLVDSPAELLTALNRQLAPIETGFATAAYGRFLPASGRLRWASAGHVPPLRISADGDVRVLGRLTAPPLGSPQLSGAPADEELQLEVGETLLLYTDGVVERRQGGIDEGIGRLVTLVAGHAGEDLDRLADRIMTELCVEPLDDCCLLLARRSA